MAIIKSMCTQCMGKGYINHYDHIANGVCFKCQGKGYIEIDTVKQSKAEQRALKRIENAKRKAQQSKDEQYKKYIEKRHEEALKMNEEYDRRKVAQAEDTETVNDALNSFFEFIEG